MNITPRKTFLVLAGSLALSVAAFAGPKITPREPFKPSYDAVQSVDTTANTITINHVNSKDTSTKVYKLDQKTEIEVNGEKGTLNDVKTGMKISVTPGFNDDEASRVVVSPAPTPVPVPGKPSK
jgi:hypothetical protein